jgi:hypothetical protein
MAGTLAVVAVAAAAVVVAAAVIEKDHCEQQQFELLHLDSQRNFEALVVEDQTRGEHIYIDQSRDTN